jgi:DNA-binding CsgD family transcriptional regulator
MAATLHTIETWIHRDKTRYLLVSKFPILNDAGVPFLVGGAALDITEHRWVQYELDEALMRLQRLVVIALGNVEVERSRTVHNDEEELTQAFNTITKQLRLLAERLSPSDESETPRQEPLSVQRLLKSAGVLTGRELDVLELLASGLRNKEIAAHLGIAEQTTQGHVKSIFAKLHVHDRTGAVAAAVRQGIIYFG